MNELAAERRAAIVRALVEGNSIRSTARLTGTAKATVLKFLVQIGQFCSVYQHYAHRNVSCKRIEATEIWAYAGAKRKRAAEDDHGDQWTYTATCTDSKLMLSWRIGVRNHQNTYDFMADVASRVANRVQLTIDGLSWSVAAVEALISWNGVDLAQVIQTYGVQLSDTDRQRQYGAVASTSAINAPVMDNRVMKKASISYVEQSGLSPRTEMSLSTRLMNGFSKKAENHAYAVSLYFMHYNYCRPHVVLTKAANGIKTTPAMAAHLTDHVWTVEEVLEKMKPEYLLQTG